APPANGIEGKGQHEEHSPARRIEDCQHQRVPQEGHAARFERCLKRSEQAWPCGAPGLAERCKHPVARCDGARGIDNRHDDANGEHEGRKKDADKTHNTTKPLEALTSRHKPRGFTLQSCYKDLIVYITRGVGSPPLRLPSQPSPSSLCALASPLRPRPHPLRAGLTFAPSPSSLTHSPSSFARWPPLYAPALILCAL